MKLDVKNMSVSKLLDLEWLDTNGLGGYASSSLSGARTRRYHGLLVAPFNPPTERRILVSKVEERIFQEDNIDDITVNEFHEGHIHPHGYRFLNSFERAPVSTWGYKGETWGLSKKVFIVPGSNTTVLVYENTGNQKFEIELHPLLANRDYHSISFENEFDYYCEKNSDSIKVHAYPDSAALYINWSKGDFIESRAWYKNFHLRRDAYRGQDCIEDSYRVGYLRTELKPGQKISLLLSTEKEMVGKKAHALEKKAIDFRNSLLDVNVENQFYNDLLVSGNQFIVNRLSTKSKTILAGYHWFTDWGRDTMIAMRGLTIATGDQKTSKSILDTFFKYLDQGMLPNRFPDYDGQEVEYNTIDASLWLFVAFYEYYKKFDDLAFVKKYVKQLAKVIDSHIEGTRYNIKVTDEGFVYGGEKGWQLTWMDAKVDGYVVTPRIGCPVEINALWYNALCIYKEFCETCSLSYPDYLESIRTKVSKNFKKYFLNDKGYLNDVVLPGVSIDDSFRSNQIHAVSLPFSLLSKVQEKKLVELVEDKLLTDYGLRTLDQDNEQFVAKYYGSQWTRDTSYHQGTVWPFILMEFWEAYLKVNKGSQKAKKRVVTSLQPLKEHFYLSDCVNAVSEIFDGGTPEQGRGCVQQAWSVAALVKLYKNHELYTIDV